MRIGADIGGTFTDVVAFDEASGEISLSKTLSTPQSLDTGVRDGIAKIAPQLGDAESIIHGSTIVINAVIERLGAKTALITTRGFRDVYEIGRINRPDSFNPRFKKHRPLIPREDVFEVNERMLADGTERAPIDVAEARHLGEQLKAEGFEAAAIVFLHAYRFTEHETQMAQILREVYPELFITCSHELSREYREYERTSTAAANAFVGPKVSRYLTQLEDGLSKDGFRGDLMIMQSNGGLSDLDTARRQCVQMMESGPAGGVVGTMVLCDLMNIEAAVAFDMGGTTAKACVVRRGEPSFSPDYFIGGYNEGLVIRIPVLEIVEVGTGGGSIAWVDDGGGLHIGPLSAGADPGPACYGLGGTEPTITDANVILGRLEPLNFLGGEMGLDAKAAEAALSARLVEPLGVDLERAASGMLEVATANMANAVRGVTLQRGLDPRDFTLVAYGGGGPLHAAAIAKELNISRIIIPQSPGHFSAVGMLMADLRRDFVQTLFRRLNDIEPAELEAEFERLEQEGFAALQGSGIPTNQVMFERAADMRYVGQEHTVTVRFPQAISGDDGVARKEIKRLFDDAHEQRYSHSAEDQPAEVVTLRVSAIGRLGKPKMTEVATGSETPPDSARRGQRAVIFAAYGAVTSQIYSRSALLAGNVIDGPAVIEETASTTIVEPGDRVTVNQYGHLVMLIGGAQ